MSEQETKKSNKTIPIFVIAGVGAFIAIIAFTGMVGEEAEVRVVDAQVDEDVQVQLDLLQLQLNNTFIVLQSHEIFIQQHQTILQEHNTQIGGIRNNTNVLGTWAEQFSNNVDERLTALEPEITEGE